MVFKEDKKNIYCKNLKEIYDNLKIYKNSGWGANSKIYIYNTKELLKVFNRPDSFLNLTTMEVLNTLNTKTIIKPNKFLIVNDKYVGFSMDIAKGEMLDQINENIIILDLLKSFVKIQEDLKILSERKLANNDINILNILYDEKTKSSKIIDCNSILFYKNTSPENLYIYSCMQLYSSLLDVLSNEMFFSKLNNNILNYMKSCISNIDSNSKVVEFFKYIIELLENSTNNEIHTIKDFRKALILSK